MIGRLFSRRIRELERQNADLRALNEDRIDDLSVVRVNYDAEKGLQAEMEGSVTRIFAAWAFNVLESCKANNYVEFSVFHPKGGAIVVTVQKRSGETPGDRISKLERELTELRPKTEAA